MDNFFYFTKRILFGSLVNSGGYSKKKKQQKIGDFALRKENAND